MKESKKAARFYDSVRAKLLAGMNRIQREFSDEGEASGLAPEYANAERIRSMA
ncbi:MAG: hypothetical protein J7M14_00980 [Planctomycetes bacterium]|nr:hypothetical protein [Planctomycetota bacterium]